MAVERRHEITRLEGFSDAVFGFALTLLVVSLEFSPASLSLMGPGHALWGARQSRARKAFEKWDAAQR